MWPFDGGRGEDAGSRSDGAVSDAGDTASRGDGTVADADPARPDGGARSGASRSSPSGPIARLSAWDHQPLLDWADDRIVEDSRRVILTFLVLTGVFAVGLGNVSMSAGTSQFTTGLPAEEALTDVNREFSPSFSPDTGNTQLIQRGPNVLAKPAMLEMLRTQAELEDRRGMYVASTSSAAGMVARQIDPSATTVEAQIRVLERSTPTQIDRAVRRAAASNDRFTGLLSNDFNRKSASASATIGLVVHEIPAGVSSGAGQGGSSPFTGIQHRAQFVAGATAGGSITVFGSGLIAEEFSAVIVDSLLIVVPAALLFILFFLSVAYRDLADLCLGLLALLVTIVWTFGFMGLAGIPFSMMLIAVPPLLLAVGIDFGIHAINRYREEQVRGASPATAMRVTTDQLLVAFFIVTGTTVIGFLSNFTSALAPIQDFGLVASVGIVFTFFTFGIFLPAAKVELDRVRDDLPIPTFSKKPLGSEESRLGTVLQAGVVAGKIAPATVLIVVLVGSVGGGVYATGVETTFSQEDFLPPEDIPDGLEQLPEPFRPSEYTVTAQTNFLQENFASTQGSQTTVYVEGAMTSDDALEQIYRAGDDPPDTYVREDGRADATSILTVIDSYAARNPAFADLVDRNDANDNGVPDDNLRTIYERLFASPVGDQARNYLTEDYRSTRVVYAVESGAEQSEVTDDTRAVADRYRMTAVATGQTVVFQAVSDLILESAIVSLAVALAGTVVFLVFIFWLLEDAPGLGLANVVPVLVTVVSIAATMRYLAIPFNAITATILAITIGLGVDYAVHVTHRYGDEREHHDVGPALERTVRGTGGALLGSMLTTVSGIGVLALAVFPAIGQFGVLTGISVAYAFLASVLVLPPALVVRDALATGNRPIRSLFVPGWGEN